MVCSDNIDRKTTTGDSDLSDAECLDDSDVECTPDVTFLGIGADTPANVDAPQTADADDTPVDIDIHVLDHLDDIVTGTIPTDLAISCADIALERTTGVANLDTLSCDNICTETTTDDVDITGSVFPDNDVVESAADADDTPVDIDIPVLDHLDDIVTGTIPADLAISCTDIALETTIGVANLDTLSCDNICSETTTDDVAITGSVFPDNDVVESAHVMTHVPDAHSSGTPEANTTPDTLCSGNINTKTTTGDSDLSDAECLDDSDVECAPDVVTFPDIVSSADIGADTPANVDAPQAADADETVLHIDIAVPDHLDEIVTGTHTC